VGLENMPLWHERDISHSSAERIVLPDAFLALDYMLDRFTWILDGLVVYPERMERNLWASHGLFFSHRLLLALVEAGLERADAYRLVQRNAMRAWDEERDFGELVRGDPEIRSALDERGLASVFDLDSTIANLDSTFDRLRRLAPKEEPVHV
jgi:adenylosuccinate lyase